jgi:hypothetical protein
MTTGCEVSHKQSEHACKVPKNIYFKFHIIKGVQVLNRFTYTYTAVVFSYVNYPNIHLYASRIVQQSRKNVCLCNVTLLCIFSFVRVLRLDDRWLKDQGGFLWMVGRQGNMDGRS